MCMIEAGCPTGNTNVCPLDVSCEMVKKTMLGDLSCQRPCSIHFMSCMMHSAVVCMQACQRYNTMSAPATPPPPALPWWLRPQKLRCHDHELPLSQGDLLVLAAAVWISLCGCCYAMFMGS